MQKASISRCLVMTGRENAGLRDKAGCVANLERRELSKFNRRKEKTSKGYGVSDRGQKVKVLKSV